MTTEYSPDELPPEADSDYQVFLSFTRATPGVIETTDQIIAALHDVGLRTFRDDGIGEFDSITKELVHGLAGAKVLLAQYSTEYPTRFACQWELTAAWIAAHRLGSPVERVLAINPEDPAAGHIAPVELADARFFGRLSTPDDLRRLAIRVREKVDAASVPLGFARGLDVSGLGAARIPRADGFVGRYREMWMIHSGLFTTEFPAVREPVPPQPVVITGIPGVGKTSLAARYAYLYRDAYPGGVFWIGPITDSNVNGPPDARARFETHFRELVASMLGKPVRDATAQQLPHLIEDLVSRRGQRVLLIVDDVPPDLLADVLGQLPVRAGLIRVLLTARTAPSAVPGVVKLAGMEAPDAAALLSGRARADSRISEDLAGQLVERSGGHPMVLAHIANIVRNRHGLATAADIHRYLAEASTPVTEVIAAELRSLGDHARDIVRVAAVLARAPFSPDIVAGVLGVSMSPLDAKARDMIGSGIDQLLDLGLVRQVDEEWQVHELVTNAVRDDSGLAEIAVRAAAVVLAKSEGAEGMSAHLIDHVRTLAKCSDVPSRQRISLCRCGARWHGQQGNPAAAAELINHALELEPSTITDLLAAAEFEIACGRYQQAAQHARRAAQEADAAADFRARYRALLLSAQALDFLGKYEEADDEFWNSMHHESALPAWMSDEERLRTLLASARAQRLRGRPKRTLTVLEPVLAELRAAPPGSIRADIAPAIRLEIARAYRLTGNARRARDVAERIIAEYRHTGRTEHAGYQAAQSVHAEAFLTLDLTERDGKEQNWRRSAEQLRDLADGYAREYGADNALALEARVQADRALISLGEPNNALAALAATDVEVARVLGADNVLRFRIWHAQGLAYGQLREFAQQIKILESLLDQQTPVFGTLHPESLETRLDLGIAFAMLGGRDSEARALVDEAARGLREMLGFTDTSGKATVAQAVVRLPYPFRRCFLGLERLFDPRDDRK
ncbi:AAA family ATPase [Nocardia brasiliensis]|uniref:AAA family ATPase n=1 Tax=Nocardia brasiliensis TaxID=37326 RepID=UPI002457DA7E|nr:AAA family ATPase [Nocardia brasiliensis]